MLENNYLLEIARRKSLGSGGLEKLLDRISFLSFAGFHWSPENVCPLLKRAAVVTCSVCYEVKVTLLWLGSSS